MKKYSLDINRKFNQNKKLVLVIILLLLSFLSLFGFDLKVGASTSNDVDANLSHSVNEIVNSIDFSQIQIIADDLNGLNLFDIDIKDKVIQILNGKYFTDYTSLGSAILNLIFGRIKTFLPVLFTIIAIGILCSMLTNFKSSSSNISDTIYFVCFAVVVIIILIGFKDILFGLSGIIQSISSQMKIIFPILITMLTTIGSITSVSIYNPMLSVLTVLVNVIFEKFLYPIFLLIFILTIIGNLTSTIKLNKLTDFLFSTFKWSVGLIFTIFSGFLTIQGISAGKFDSISIKTTKFAMKSYIPIIGAYISDGIDFLVLGSVLVKNSIGLVGVILIFVTIISPIINIIIYKLGLQLASAILELSGEQRFTNFISKCSKVLILPVVILLGIAFMYIITIALIMCTANLF